MSQRKTGIIVSASSDIGYELAVDWINKGFKVIGTYRTWNENLDSLKKLGVHLHHCDLAEKKSVNKFCDQLLDEKLAWDALVLAPGLQDPVGLLREIDFDEWESSIQVNFINQVRIAKKLMPTRIKKQEEDQKRRNSKKNKNEDE